MSRWVQLASPNGQRRIDRKWELRRLVERLRARVRDVESVFSPSAVALTGLPEQLAGAEEELRKLEHPGET